ncbi:MAG: hypothetical protein H7Z41_17215 [Cytophagales bacterium]|nr:hypothetical protein [Armatimonadota bacterium]
MSQNRRALLFSLLLLPIALAPHARAKETPHTPPMGSAERRQITDALRVPVAKALKQKVVFEIRRLKVLQGWAFLDGAPRQPGGKPINYEKTPYAEAKKEGAFDDGVVALLKRSPRGKWTVVTYALGATDVPYVDWDRRYRAPRAIFGLPPGAR